MNARLGSVRPEVSKGEEGFDTSARAELWAALRFITCGSVDDGKSTLIGRLLVDSRVVLRDQLASVSRSGAADLALLTDGLAAEREQGITIDVAWRYFATPARKFIIGDAPGHEQYTRNMVTAASNADAAVVLVDATKLPWASAGKDGELLPQTRRHALLAHLLRVPSIVFAVNKLDAVEDAERAFERIAEALRAFTSEAGIDVTGIVPISALQGFNVVDARPGWCGYCDVTLLELLERLPTTGSTAPTDGAFALPVQWVERTDRRVFWGRVAAGNAKAGLQITVFPSGQTAVVAEVLDHARKLAPISTGFSAGIVLDREVDVARGDWLLASNAEGNPQPQRELNATVAWMDEEPLVAGRTYWLLHGHRWVKAKAKQITHRLDIGTLEKAEAPQLQANDIGGVRLLLQEPLPALPYAVSRTLGAAILVDTASHKTSGALLIH